MASKCYCCIRHALSGTRRVPSVNYCTRTCRKKMKTALQEHCTASSVARIARARAPKDKHRVAPGRKTFGCAANTIVTIVTTAKAWQAARGQPHGHHGIIDDQGPTIQAEQRPCTIFSCSKVTQEAAGLVRRRLHAFDAWQTESSHGMVGVTTFWAEHF